MSSLRNLSICSGSRGLLRDAAPTRAFYLTEILLGLTDLTFVGALPVEFAPMNGGFWIDNRRQK